jgi:chorismate mutase
VNPEPDIEELRDLINRLDNDIIQLWDRRCRASGEVGRLRVAAGGTRIVLNREGQVIDKYQDRLGPIGAELALLVLRAGRGPLGLRSEG